MGCLFVHSQGASPYCHIGSFCGTRRLIHQWPPEPGPRVICEFAVELLVTPGPVCQSTDPCLRTIATGAIRCAPASSHACVLSPYQRPPGTRCWLRVLSHSCALTFLEPVTVAIPVTILVLEAQSHTRLPTLPVHALPLISSVFLPFKMSSSHSGLIIRIGSLSPILNHTGINADSYSRQL